jgi:hypothetical protein
MTYSSIVQRVRERLAARATLIWPAGLVIIGVLYALFIVRPFDSAAPSSEASDVAVSWNSSIGQLGISGLYPPQEDFYVGDVFAVLVEAPSVPLLEKSVLVGHIDLSEAIQKSNARRISFVGSDEDSANANEASNAPIGKSQIRLSSVAFPGVTIARLHSDASRPSLGPFSLSAGRDTEQSDEINIPSAETYGADTIDAQLGFYAFCEDSVTKLRCEDGFLRNVLAAAFDQSIVTDSAKQPRFKIRLQLITQVYLTNSIDHKQTVRGAVNINAAVIAGQGGARKSTAPDASDQSVQSTPQSTTISRENSDTTDITFKETFKRPLVFGYQALTFVPN